MSDQSHDSRDEGTTVAEAARILGITEGAVRKRVERGKLAARRTPDGRLIVHLERDTTATDTTRQSRDDRYTRGLEAEVEYLRRQLDQEREARTEERRRHDTLMAQLTQANAALAARIPELEASSTQEPAESPETVEEEPERAPPPRPSTGGPEVATEGLSEAEPSLLWERVVVVILSILVYIFPIGLALSTDISPSWAGYVLLGSWALASIVFPAVFGVRLGRKVRSLRFWRGVAPVAAVLGLCSYIAAWTQVGAVGGVIFGGIPSLVYSFAAVLGNALRRRQREKLIEERPSDFPPEAVSGTQRWTPRQQAIVGLAGTIISALIGLIGTILTVMASGNGG